MLADFTIIIHSEPKRAVRVCVHNNVKQLRTAAIRHDRSWKSKSIDHTETLGICHRFEIEHILEDHSIEHDPLCAIVRLAPPHLGVGVISHEMAHAAVWIRELDKGEKTPLTCDNDEEFCWVLGELVRQTVNKLGEKGVFDIE